MKGSEKQIKWAEDIREKVAAALPDMSANPMADKAKSYVLNINDSRFWIDEARHYIDTPINLLRHLIGKGGLAIRGSEFSHRAKMDEKTGVITITWKEIVQDGKGGHHETRQIVS